MGLSNIIKKSDMESSDYTRLDYKTINEFFPKGQLSILAAGPGVGKTVFATQIANQFCRHGENTLYFCLEYDSRVWGMAMSDAVSPIFLVFH